MLKEIVIKRIYDEPEKGDGFRVLVDRLWPRGIKKEAAQLDLWFKEVAPSTELRQWFNHDPKKWATFKDRYSKELASQHDLITSFLKSVKKNKITLLYASKEVNYNHAIILRDVLKKQLHHS